MARIESGRILRRLASTAVLIRVDLAAHSRCGLTSPGEGREVEDGRRERGQEPRGNADAAKDRLAFLACGSVLHGGGL